MSGNPGDDPPTPVSGVRMTRGSSILEEDAQPVLEEGASVQELLVAMRSPHEEAENLRTEHDDLKDKVKTEEDTVVDPSQVRPQVFETIDAPKHRSHVEFVKAARRKSIAPKTKRSDSDLDQSDSEDDSVTKIVKVQ